MARNSEKKKAYDIEYQQNRYNKVKELKALNAQQEEERKALKAQKEEERKKRRAAKRSNYQRSYKRRKKEEKMAANENSVVYGTPLGTQHTSPRCRPPRAGSSPYALVGIEAANKNSVVYGTPSRNPAPGGNLVRRQMTDEKLNIILARMSEGSKFKQSNIQQLNETQKNLTGALLASYDKFQASVEKANDREDEATAFLVQLAAGDNQNYFEETETSPEDMDIDLLPHQELTPSAPTNLGIKFGGFHDPNFTTPSTAPTNGWTFGGAGGFTDVAPTNGGPPFGAPTKGGFTDVAPTNDWPPFGAPTKGGFPSLGAPTNDGSTFGGAQFPSKSKRQRTDSPDGCGSTEVKRHRI